MFTGEGCSELALKKHVHEMFYKEYPAVRFVSNYKQPCRSCSQNLYMKGKLKIIQSNILLWQKAHAC